MFQARRPKGRLFYLLAGAILMVVGVRLGSIELHAASGKPTASPDAKAGTAEPTTGMASPSPQSGPTETSVIEVRTNDYGWGQANDRNLLGRFNVQTFSLFRVARTQGYFLRLYDNSSPPKYSRYSAALHVDYPL